MKTQLNLNDSTHVISLKSCNAHWDEDVLIKYVLISDNVRDLSVKCKVESNEHKSKDDYMLRSCLDIQSNYVVSKMFDSIKIAITKTLRIQKKENTKDKKNMLYIVVI